MKIMVANKHLQPIADFLASMPLKAQQSRARSKLLTLLRQAIDRFAEDEYDLVKAYATLDDDGRPVFDKEGTFVLANPDKTPEFLQAREELMNSLAEVSGPTYHGHHETMVDVLDTYDGQLSGQSADAYNVLYDALEKENS